MTQEEGKGNMALSQSKTDNDQSNKMKPDKREKQAPPTKVVIRRLPPSMNRETFLDQISPVPDHDYMYFVRADMSLGQNAFSRAYINFIHQQDIFIFKDKFDGYVFVDSKGNEYPAVVEFSPFQKVPKKKAKKDSKSGTIEQDPDYIKFIESLNNPEEITLPSAEFYLEEIENKEREMRANNGEFLATTPLIEYLKQRRAEKQRIREEKREERRRRDLEKKRIKEEERRRRKLEKEKEREKIKDKERFGKESDTDKPASSYKTSKDAPVKLLKNPEREKVKETDADGKDGARDSVDDRRKVRNSSGDKYSRGSTYHYGESEADRRSQYDSKLRSKDKFKDRKERDRFNRKGNESGSHSSKPTNDYKKDLEERSVSKRVSGDQAYSSSSSSFKKSSSSRGGKSYERTRETVAKSRVSRVTFDCSSDRTTDVQKDEPKMCDDASVTETDSTTTCCVDDVESKESLNDIASQEDDLTTTKKRSNTSSSQDAKLDRRIRNKDRPSMEIYRPGMRRLSLQRNSPQKESPTSSSSPSPTAQLSAKTALSSPDIDDVKKEELDSHQMSPSDELPPSDFPEQNANDIAPEDVSENVLDVQNAE